MRLLMTTDTVGGVWRYAQTLCEGLLAEGWEVLLVTLGRRLQHDQQLWVEAMSKRWRQRWHLVATTYRLEWMPNAERDLAESAWLVERLVREFRPDVFHANQFYYGVLDVSVPKILVAHSDVYTWWQAVKGCPPPDEPRWRDYRNWVLDGIRGADKLVFPTRWLRDEFRSAYPGAEVSMPEVRVITNGSAIPGDAATQGRPMRALTAGRLWDEGKNIRELTLVADVLPMAVAGEVTGPENGLASQDAAGLDLLGALSQQELNAAMRKHAIYIVTSVYEPFGLTAVEAALRGCALVVRDIASQREVWGDAALYYQDARSLRTMLEGLKQAHGLAASLGQRAAERARDHYSASAMVSGYQDLYSACFAEGVAA